MANWLNEKIAPMLAGSASPFDSEKHLFEIKWDGIRALTFAQDSSYRLLTRNRNEISEKNPELASLSGLPDGTVLDTFISTGPPPVSNLRAMVVDSCVALIWSPVAEADHYVIYRDSLAGFIPGPEDSVGLTMDTSYVDCDPVGGQAYYAVRSVDAIGRKSEDSQQVGQFGRGLISGE